MHIRTASAICFRSLFPILLLPACAGPADESIEMQERSLATEGGPPYQGTWIEGATALVTGLSSSYKDIASSSTRFYLLTDTGIKRVNHTDYSTIKTAPIWKTITLHAIDYVDSTWNVVGARNKAGSTPAQVVLKIENTTPTTVSLSSDIVTVWDVEAKANSTTSLEIFVGTSTGPGNKEVREYRWASGTLTFVRTIYGYQFETSGFTIPSTTGYSYIVGANSNGGFNAFVKRNTTSPYAMLVENQRIDIDNGGIPGAGTTYVIYSHGVNGSVLAELIYPSEMDWAVRSDGSRYYVFLNPTGSGTYDLVQLEDSQIIFNKTPAREFSYWNDFSHRQGSNNCYNYANNRNTMNFAQPGFASGNELTVPITEDMLQSSATSDGLEYVAGSETSPVGGALPTVPEGKSLVAAIVGTYDYHWFRRDRDGRWTHKPGFCQAMDKKYDRVRGGYYTNNAAMTDPRDPNSWSTSYNDFAGFFLVDSNYFQGMGWENVQGDSYDPWGPGGNCIESAGASASSTATASAKSATGQGLFVTLGLYSGRPNPQFVINDAANIEQIKAIYGSAQQTDGAPNGALAFDSYTGITVGNPCGLSGLPQYFTIFNNHITVALDEKIAAATDGRAGMQHLSESTSSLETLLLDHAAAKGIIDSVARRRVWTNAAK